MAWHKKSSNASRKCRVRCSLNWKIPWEHLPRRATEANALHDHGPDSKLSSWSMTKHWAREPNYRGIPEKAARYTASIHINTTIKENPSALWLAHTHTHSTTFQTGCDSLDMTSLDFGFCVLCLAGMRQWVCPLAETFITSATVSRPSDLTTNDCKQASRLNVTLPTSYVLGKTSQELIPGKPSKI